MDGQTRCLKDDHFQQFVQCVEGKSEWKKTAYGAKHMPKQKTISNSNSISILGIPSMDSRPKGKSNICAFHEENHAFEDWNFVRLSSLVLASEWTTNQNKFIV